MDVLNHASSFSPTPRRLLEQASPRYHRDAVGGDFGELTVWLDAEQGLLITRDETEHRLDSSRPVPGREASASYEMRFGSVLIEETTR